MPQRFACLLLILALVTATTALAQEPPPDVINAALADLNAQTGANLTLEAPELQWTWAQETYPDASLGCPQPDQMYAQVVTDGYLILFTYNGLTYDYRASADGQTLFLCSSYPAQTIVQPTAAELAAPAAAPATISNTTAASVTQIAAVEGQMVAPLAWSPTGQWIAVAGLPGARDTGGGQVFLFNADDLQAEPSVLDVDQPVSALTYFFAEPVAFLVTGGLAGGVSLLQVEPEGFDIVPMQTAPDAQAINSVAITPDGTMIASASGSAFAPEGVSENAVRLWNAQTGEALGVIDATEPVGAVAFSPDGTRLAYGTGDGVVHLIDTANAAAGGPETTLTGHGDLVRDLAFSPDGQWLASGSLDGTARVWNLASDPAASQPIILDPQTDDAIFAVGFSADGTVLATAGGNPDGNSVDNAIRLWDPTTGALLATLPGHAGTVGDLAFSPDGSRFATVGDDRTLRLWGIAGTQEAAG